MKFYHIAEKRDGHMIYNHDKLRHLVEILYEGKYLVSFQRLEPKSSIKDYRRCYFAKIDALAFESGNTRYDIHELVKESIIEPMIDETPDVFNAPMPEASTQYLTVEGWSILLERLDIFAFVNYNVILQ